MENSLFIDLRTTSGFFSNYLIWVDNLKYCEVFNLKPIMRLYGNWFYSDNRENLWDYYFEKINDGIPVGNQESSNFFKFWDDNNFTIRKGKVMIWDVDDKELVDKNRIEVNKITKKIIPVERIQEKINSFVSKNFKNKKVLGVHIRGTDYGFNDLNAYLENIKKYDNFDVIFVASDNFESINFIKNNFKNVCNYETELRMNNINESVLCRNIYEPNNKLKHGEDVLIETYILSKCDHLICINSNVAASALYINPDMTYDMIYRSEHGG